MSVSENVILILFVDFFSLILKSNPLFMKKLLLYIATMWLSCLLTGCSSGFNQDKADEMLGKSVLTSEEYSELIDIYEKGMDDAIEFSKKKAEDLSKQEQKEVLTVFAIGMRLSKDESHLNATQVKEFERINKKGTEELKK